VGRWLTVCWLSTCVMAGCEPATTTVDGGRAMDGARPDSNHWAPIDASRRDVGMDSPSTPCSITCATDDDCAASCGSVPGGGLRCCDSATRRCYVSHAAYCPVTVPDAGHDTALRRADTAVDSDVDAACPPSGSSSTEIAVSVPGMPGATVTVHSYYWAPTTLTLDASGSAVVRGQPLSIGAYGGNLSLLDVLGLPVSFELSQGTATANVYPACIAPDPGSLQPLDRVDVILQRDRATGLCAGSVLSVVVECVPLMGEYTPAMFDDMPCGPFR
jgi:hypothetical protein